MIVKVTKEHIEKGNLLSRHSCPVALALQDCGFRDAMVWTHKITASGLRDTKSPKSVVRFVRAFDSKKPVKPFTFRISKPKAVSHD